MPFVITNPMIEAAAQAIREQATNRSGRGQPWNSLPEALKASYRAEALVALDAAVRCLAHPTSRT